MLERFNCVMIMTGLQCNHDWHIAHLDWVFCCFRVWFMVRYGQYCAVCNITLNCYNSLCRLLYPLHNEVVWGYIGFTQSVCPSVCPASHVCSVAPTVLVGSFSYLYILSINFRRCVAWKVSSKIFLFIWPALYSHDFKNCLKKQHVTCMIPRSLLHWIDILLCGNHIF